jgi:hypothetical protein
MGAVQHRGTVLADFKVCFHAGPQFGFESVVDIVRDLSPHLEAANFDHHRVDAGTTILLHLL